MQNNLYLLTAMHSFINYPEDNFKRLAIVSLNKNLFGFKEIDMV